MNGLALVVILGIAAFCAALSGAMPPPSTDAPSPTGSSTSEEPADDDGFEPGDGGGGGSDANVTTIELDMNEIPASTSSEGNYTYTGTLQDLLELYRLEVSTGALDVDAGFTDEHFEEDESDEEEGDSRGRAQRAIFSDDERLAVGGRRYYNPYCAVGYLANGCTATLVGPYHALTAAHCVYNIQTRRWKPFSDMTLYRRRDCSSYGDRMVATNAYATVGYTQQYRQDYDWALIVYRSSDRSPCYLGFAYYTTWPEVGLDVTGYPSDKSTGCSYRPMWSGSCHYSRSSTSGLEIAYRCDTYGNSGSALYGERKIASNSDLKRYVVGVHAHTGRYTNFNSGPRITRDRFYLIVGWMRGTGYDPL